MNTQGLLITKHAYKRAKERCGWNKSATDRMAKKIFEQGMSVKEVKGTLKPWVEIKLEHGGSLESRIYGDVLYVIREGKLITMYHVPSKVRIQNKICRRHIEKFVSAI